MSPCGCFSFAREVDYLCSREDETMRAAKIPNAPTAQPSAPVDKSKWDTQDSTQAKTILGTKFRPFAETVVDTLSSIKRRFPEVAV